MNCPPAKLIGIGFLLAGVAACLVGLWIHFNPARYQASVRVDISDAIDTLIPPDPKKFYFDSDTYVGSLIPGEAKVFKSDAVLHKTVQNLNLSNEWKVTTNKAVKLLKRCVSSKMTGDWRIEITATDTNQEHAVKIINGLVDAYCQFRGGQWQQTQQAIIERQKKSLPELARNLKAAQEKFDQVKSESNMPNPTPDWANFKTNNPAYFEAGEKLWVAEIRYNILNSEIQPGFPRFASIDGKVEISEFHFPDWLGPFLCKSSAVICLFGWLIILIACRKSSKALSVTSP